MPPKISQGSSDLFLEAYITKMLAILSPEGGADWEFKLMVFVFNYLILHFFCVVYRFYVSVIKIGLLDELHNIFLHTPSAYLDTRPNVSSLPHITMAFSHPLHIKEKMPICVSNKTVHNSK